MNRNLAIVAILVFPGLAACHSTQKFGGDATADGVGDTAGDGTVDGTVDPGLDTGDATDTWADVPSDIVVDGVEVPWDPDPPPGACPEGWTCLNAESPMFSGVDVLVVVDNSRSMSEEQLNMSEQFPELIRDLLDPPLHPTTGRPTHVPITDLHVGVVSTDMGTGGYTVETCSDPVDGDDGLLQHEPSPSMSGCDPSYPLYLAYDEDGPNPDLVESLARDFGCIAVLGTDGCGFEQQLQAALRAFEHAAPGGPSAGFLRDDTILMVFWLSDEEDCSVRDDPESQAIFDTTRTDLGHLNLRCWAFPEFVEPVETYVDAFRALRAGSIWPVILGMLVGVPPDEKECNGYGNQIPICLEMGLMQEVIDPADPTRLVPSCNTFNGLAFPPRRFVEIAQEFGPNAYVHSICQDDYLPAITALSHNVNVLADLTCEATIVSLVEDGSECGCATECRVVHVLDGMGECPAGLAEWDHDGDGVPNDVRDAAGDPVRACEVPYAGTLRESCGRECHDPYQTYAPEGEGWYYSLSYTGVACPTVSFTPGFETPAGATTFVACP